MDLHDALSTGDLGLQLRLPKAEALESSPTYARYFDRDHHVLIEVRHLPWRLDLSPQNEAPHFRDCAREARAVFDANTKPDPFAQWRVEKSEPRTADPSWSPVIEIATLEHNGAPLLRSIQRITYMPGDELIQGQLLIPLPTSTAEVRVLAKADQTGTRECVLMVKLGGTPTQAQYDDPAWDETFHDHPLARIRAFLAGLLAGEALRITTPDQALPPQELELPLSRSVILPPARFRRLDPQRFPMAPTIDVLSRIALQASTSVNLLDVYWMKGQAPPANLADLEALARANSQGWVHSGMSEINVEVTGSGQRPDGLSLATRVSFKTKEGEPKVTLKRWRVFQDRVVRIAMSIPPWQPEHEAAAELDLVAESWRPLE